MAFDAGMLSAVLKEINDRAGGCKIDRITQPAADEIDLLLSDRGQKHRLTIHAGASCPYMALSDIEKENPATPPMFCMLLRKHLAGARFLFGEQVGFERVARLFFDGYDEMGYPAKKILAVEIMGKCSNLMLLNESEKVLAVLRPVDFSTSRKRQVLPGMAYELPPAQEKINPLAENEGDFLSRLAAAPQEESAVSYLLSTYAGLATQTASEIVYGAVKTCDAVLSSLSHAALAKSFLSWFEKVKSGVFTPTLVTDEKGTMLDYTYAPTAYRGQAAVIEKMPSFSALFDRFFGTRDLEARMHRRASDLFHLLKQSENRLLRKLALQRDELADCEKADTYKKTADLITANLYHLKKGASSFSCIDYSSGEGEEVTLPLDSRLTPASNAQRLYKQYAKAKKASVVLVEQIKNGEEELAYLSGVADFLSRATTENDLLDIREELQRTGYLSRQKGQKIPPRSKKMQPRVFVTSGGYRLLCGRNNLQNDELTFQRAEKDDLWFHVKGVPGSHVILQAGGEEPSEKDYTEAAELAAFYSSLGKTEGTVAVDYTRVRYVKKPAGAKPGYVIYKTNYTAYVSPRLTLTEEKQKG